MDPRFEEYLKDKNYKEENGLIYKLIKGSYKLLIPKEPDILLEVLHENHDVSISGHLGIDKTL